ncbi:MAG: tetratricopeptide repeat protein [Bacteroidota bacterium]
MNLDSIYRDFLSIIVAVSAFFYAPQLWAQGQEINEQELAEAKTAYIDGLTAFENNDYQEALTLLNKAYIKLPGHAGINFALADVYLQINDLKNAEYYSKQSINLDPENRWYHLQLVDIYQVGGQNDAAIKELKNALRYFKNDTDILYELAQTYTEMGQLSEANNIYNKLLRLKGETISIHLEKLKNFKKLDQQDSALVELEQIRDLEPTNLSTIHLLSDYYLKLNRVDDARTVLDDALTLNPDDIQTLISLSNVYIAQNHWDSLATKIEPIIADSTISEDDKLKIAQYIHSKYEEDKDNEQLRQTTSTIFNKLIETDSTSGKAHALAADFFMDTGQHEQALEALEQTTKLLPSNDSAWKQRLQLLLSEHRIQETIEVGQQAIKQVPQDPLVLYFLGSAYLSDKQYQKAEEHLTEASALPARNTLKANIYGSLGDTYAALKNWNDAFEYYQQAVDLDTQNASIYENYAYHLSRQEKNLSKAQELAQQAVTLNQQNASALHTLGWILYQQGEFEQAKKHLQKALETGAADAEMMEHMGNILHKLDEAEEAKQWWQKALDSDSTRTYLKEKISN